MACFQCTSFLEYGIKSAKSKAIHCRSSGNCKRKCCSGLSHKFWGQGDLTTIQLSSIIVYLLSCVVTKTEFDVAVVHSLQFTSGLVCFLTLLYLNMDFPLGPYIQQGHHPSSAKSVLIFFFRLSLCLLICFSMPLSLLLKRWLRLSQLLLVRVPVPRLVCVPRHVKGGFRPKVWCPLNCFLLLTSIVWTNPVLRCNWKGECVLYQEELWYQDTCEC